MRKKGLIFLFLLIFGLIGYNYLYQDHRDIGKENPDVEMTSKAISELFFSDSQTNEKKYNDKTIQVIGTVTDINDTDLTLDDGVFCLFNSKIDSAFKVGDKIQVKGRCIGYDDLLEQVKLNECSIIKK